MVLIIFIDISVKYYKYKMFRSVLIILSNSSIEYYNEMVLLVWISSQALSFLVKISSDLWSTLKYKNTKNVKCSKQPCFSDIKQIQPLNPALWSYLIKTEISPSWSFVNQVIMGIFLVHLVNVWAEELSFSL